jgi:hypothetical protein
MYRPGVLPGEKYGNFLFRIADKSAYMRNRDLSGTLRYSFIYRNGRYLRVLVWRCGNVLVGGSTDRTSSCRSLCQCVFALAQTGNSDMI